MTNNEILQADMLDILFEHRNKNYGAYALRRNYNSRIGLALGIALSLVLIAVLSSFINNKNNRSRSTTHSADSVIIHKYEIPKESEIKPEQKTEKVKTVKSVNKIEIVPDNTKPDMPEISEIEKSVVGTEKADGKELDDPNKIVKTGIDKEGDNKPIEAKPEPDYITESSPASFPGGVESWLNFLRRYLQTPEDLENGQRVEVRVKFWIETDGSLSRFEIVHSGGSAFDKEVLRVMKKMPKWQPASQNRNKVAVSYTQPVIFIGVEE